MIGSVILWMTLYNYDTGKFVMQERFQSVYSCERFVSEFRSSAGEKPRYKGHFCYEDK